MDKKLVLELDNHNVYYIKTDSVNYYLNIPKNSRKSTICLELKSKMANYNLDMNDELWVMENVKNTFSYIDEYNITLVLPILDEDNTLILEKIDSSRYDGIDKILGQVINSAYINLKNDNIDIENKIIFVNNERFKSFINWFSAKYQERVSCKNLLDIIRIYNINATSYKKLETPGMTFVVGSYSTEVNAPKAIKEEEKENMVIANQKLLPQASGGFTNYWLLVIITIVVSAIVAIIAFTS